MLTTRKDKSIPKAFFNSDFGARDLEYHQHYGTGLYQEQQKLRELARQNLHQEHLRQKQKINQRLKGTFLLE